MLLRGKVSRRQTFVRGRGRRCRTGRRTWTWSLRPFPFGSQADRFRRERGRRGVGRL